MSNITELCLEGNPLDNNVQLTSEYINEFKKIFPNLNVLDGEIITNQCLFLPTKQNYICDLEAKNFIECFVKHYFKIYDSVQRFHLKGIIKLIINHYILPLEHYIFSHKMFIIQTQYFQ